MPVSERHISAGRKATALAKFKRKVIVLEGMVGKPFPSSGLSSTLVRPFIRWVAPELGVTKISPSTFYSTLPEHTALRKRADDALRKLANARVRPKAAASELSSTKLELKQSKHGHRITETELVRVQARLDEVSRELAIMKQRVKRKHEPTKTNVLPFAPPRAGKPPSSTA